MRISVNEIDYVMRFKGWKEGFKGKLKGFSLGVFYGLRKGIEY